MSEIISFHGKKLEFLRIAVEQAETLIDKHQAELGWLQQNGASIAEVVKISMRLEKAVLHHRERAAALAVQCKNGDAEPVIDVCAAS